MSIWRHGRRKLDDNHRAVVEALRKIGASVQPLTSVGRGCPDLLVGIRGRNFLLEVKDGAKSPSRRKLEPAQEVWRAGWYGTVWTVNSVDQAVKTVLDRSADP